METNWIEMETNIPMGPYELITPNLGTPPKATVPPIACARMIMIADTTCQRKGLLAAQAVGGSRTKRSYVIRASSGWISASAETDWRELPNATQHIVADKNTAVPARPEGDIVREFGDVGSDPTPDLASTPSYRQTRLNP